MIGSLAELSQLIACPVCKLKSYKSWYYESGYHKRKKGFVLYVYFECCVCDEATKVLDMKLAKTAYELMNHPNDEIDE